MTLGAASGTNRPRPGRLTLAAIVTLVGVALAVLVLVRPSALFRPSGGAVEGLSGGRQPPPAPSGPPAPAWGSGVKVNVLFQKVIDRMPEGAPYVFRLTELEMEPGAKIFEHRQLSVGTHLVVKGSITIEDLEARQAATYRAGQAYFEGLEPLHRAENAGSDANRVLMFDLLPASRKFDGTQQFTERGRHNSGEIRSGPYVQVPLGDLPSPPLMLRVIEMQFGPKAKTVEHVRLGPALFFVREGTATVRKDWDNSSMTYGTDGYLFESGREPFILENKPARPARFVAVELLPASIGDGPSTVPTGGRADDD